MPQPPANAFQQGTRLNVGTHKVSIIKYISAGGFATVYTCNIEPSFQGSNIACLKRVVVPSKWQLSLLRQEVDAMRRLRGNKHIVSYIDSHAARLNTENDVSKEQQYEVLLLMEYCENNGLIDFMNTRLVNKLTEKEIIDIMYQVTIGVAMCHHLRPPLIHRDIKIENVLIDSNHVFKLCDFGSSVNYMLPPKNPSELQLMKDDLMQHTTPQYRAPEMIDLTKGFPIDDKSDIWALGVFLYKLCYYTTPFESPNQTSMQDLERCILNCHQTLRFHDQPGSMFSSRLKNIIKVCLRADPRRRPNALQLLGEIAQMRGDSGVPNVVPTSVLEAREKPQQLSQQPSQSVPRQPSKSQAQLQTQPKKEPISEAKKLSPQPPPPPPTSSKPTADAFSTLDKSKFLNKLDSKIETKHISPFESEPIPSPNRPLSAYFDSGHKHKIYSQGNKSSPAVQDLVRRELQKGYKVADLGPQSTLEFLKTRENEKEVERNESGVKSAWNTLRRISTGGSTNNGGGGGDGRSGGISANNTGASEKSLRRRSIREVLTGSRRSSDENVKNTNSKTQTHTQDQVQLKTQSQAQEHREKENSIQKRMQALLEQSERPNVKKTASGYGKFTDRNVADDINSINESPYSKSSYNKKPQHQQHQQHQQQNHQHNSSLSHSHKHKHKKLSPPKVPVNLSSTRKSLSPESSIGLNKKIPPPKPKKPPTKPRKPTFLKTTGNDGAEEERGKVGNDELLESRRLSVEELSIPDIDDLEKQFAKRFPSYV
ncbi:actin-regulating kinase prk1 [Lodderomyces elongisporus]|uniref:actin-regulating kinase prk1 n=1 Tax=Lodderomyces elongisporus TaxID=36914 RepID=UPI0029214310|nr:actin-regulating kinase prk1 [Lodderomyces elongisporus]WLF76360.1 actin-regulating kinase prk1 [Lodderomyces elongisporus]